MSQSLLETINEEEGTSQTQKTAQLAKLTPAASSLTKANLDALMAGSFSSYAHLTLADVQSVRDLANYRGDNEISPRLPFYTTYPENPDLLIYWE